jgi:hypothetical protein
MISFFPYLEIAKTVNSYVDIVSAGTERSGCDEYFTAAIETPSHFEHFNGVAITRCVKKLQSQVTPEVASSIYYDLVVSGAVHR